MTDLLELWMREAKKGNPYAQNNLGICYEYGIGVEKDFEKAVYLYTEAAKLGNLDAQNNLGICYEYGVGVELDFGKAVYWYKKAAELGHAKAQLNLGVCYENGTGVEINEEKAIHWYTKAAEQGDSEAQYTMAKCYEYGSGVKKDLEKSVYWYTKAAEQGDLEAQYNLGLCYEEGSGVEEDEEKAFYWYMKAAEQGDVDAQYNVGVCYEYENGVKLNYKKAAYWYRLAAEQGDEEAGKKLKELQDRLGVRFYNRTKTQKVKNESCDEVRGSASKGEKTVSNHYKLSLDPERVKRAFEEQKYTEECLRINYDEMEGDVSALNENPASARVRGNPVGESSSNIWAEFVSRLDSSQAAYLRGVLNGVSLRELRGIVAGAGKMEGVFVDEINGVCVEVVGDVLIVDGDIVEEYADELRGVLF